MTTAKLVPYVNVAATLLLLVFGLRLVGKAGFKFTPFGTTRNRLRTA